MLTEHEAGIRLTVFLGVLTAMAAWELAAPRRRFAVPRLLRWSNNLALVVIDTLLVRLAFPMAAVGLALTAAAGGWGLLNRTALPGWADFVIALLALDLAIYFQHVLFHAVPALWRLHRMHHADLGFDVSTGLRFHPLEILLSMGLKLGVVAALGPPAAAVLVFEVALNAGSLFNHANIRLPPQADRLLRLLLVTPDMHRVHHSIHADEMNRNFGFTVPWWDRLFGTYRARPRDGQEAMAIGVPGFRDPGELWLHRMLLQPLREPTERDNSTGQPAEKARKPAN